ncbi:MAG: phosphoglycerate dehydrogenase [Atopobiaceae bacterium]|jgi:D-3-phosphoglycerate dehydrogenase
MRHIKLYNNIKPENLTGFGRDYDFADELDDTVDAILLRSQNILDLELPKAVRCIARAGAGVNNIPHERYAKDGVVVFNTPGANANAVKELVVGLILISSRDVLGGIHWCREHADDDNVYKEAEAAKKAFVGREVMGKRIGIVGLGAIGSHVADTCIALGMDVYGYDPYLSIANAWNMSREVHRMDSLDDLCRGCDYLTVHVPATPSTKGLVTSEQLDLLNDGAIVLNYSREGVIEEPAIAAALKGGKVKNYITDFATPAVLHMDGAIVTPHAGAGTAEAEDNCTSMAVDEIRDYLENGNIRNSVNYPSCNMGACSSAGRFACLHSNTPNVIGQITSALGGSSVNIQRMANEAKGENSYTMIDVDGPVEEATYEKLRAIPGVYRVRIIRRAEG